MPENFAKKWKNRSNSLTLFFFKLQIHSSKLDNPLYVMENGTIEALELPVMGGLGFRNEAVNLPKELDIFNVSSKRPDTDFDRKYRRPVLV